MDASSATLFTFGLASLLMSWVLLLITSWKEDFTWGAVHTAAAPRVLSLRSLTTEQSGGADRIRDRRVVFNPVQLAYDSAAHQPNAL